MNEQDNYDWMVLVSCATFNQASYIVDALNGFTMQETNFPFVCAIVDDASNDGEQDIIKNYLNEHFDLEDKGVVRQEETDDYVLTFARHKINLNCFFAVLFLKYNHYSKRKSKDPYLSQWQDNAKYIAICEGDDYWINSQKLQSQIDILDSSPSAMLVGSNGIIQFMDKSKGLAYFNAHFQQRKVAYGELCAKWTFPTASLVFRKIVKDNFPEWASGMIYGDQVTIMVAAGLGDVYTLGKITCVYRKGCGITSIYDKKKALMASQHLYLYTHLLEDTGDRFRKELMSRIKCDKKDILYYDSLSHSKIRALFVNPKRLIRDILYSGFIKLKHIMK